MLFATKLPAMLVSFTTNNYSMFFSDTPTKKIYRCSPPNSLVKLNYLPPNHQDECYKNFKHNFDLKITEKVNSEILNLPCHQYMTKNEIETLSNHLLNLIN